MPGLTRALIANHGRGRNEAFGPALLDIAQDHLLYLLAVAGRLDGDGLIFKGGTSLRKCRIGGTGRFSTDIDFAAPSDDVAIEEWERLVRTRFQFLADLDDDERRWAGCDHRHREEIEAAISVLRT